MIIDIYEPENERHGKYNSQDICFTFSQIEKAMVAAFKLT